MLFFSKPEYKEMILPFTYEDNPEELYAGILSIEVYANILGEYKYCSSDGE